jgi:hypothetical protein
MPPERTEFADNWRTLHKTVQAALRSSLHADVYQVVVKAVPVDREGSAMTLVPPPIQTATVVELAQAKSRIAVRLAPDTEQRMRQGFRRVGARV